MTFIFNKKDYIQLDKPLYFDMGQVECIVLQEAYHIENRLILPIYCKINKRRETKQEALISNHKYSNVIQDVFEFDHMSSLVEEKTEYKTAYVEITIHENKKIQGSWKSTYVIKDAPAYGLDFIQTDEMNIECNPSLMKIHKINDLNEINKQDSELCFKYGINYEEEYELLKLNAYRDYNSEELENKFLEMMNHCNEMDSYVFYDSKIHAEGFIKEYVKYSKRSLVITDTGEDGNISDEAGLKYYTGTYAFIPLRLDTSEKKIEIVESTYKSALFKLYRDDETYVTYLGIELSKEINQDFIFGHFIYEYNKERYSLYVGCKLSKCKQTNLKYLDDLEYL